MGGIKGRKMYLRCEKRGTRIYMSCKKRASENKMIGEAIEERHNVHLVLQTNLILCEGFLEGAIILY